MSCHYGCQPYWMASSPMVTALMSQVCCGLVPVVLPVLPLLGAGTVDLAGITWVIVGGESGPGVRPMDPSWAMALRNRCREAGTAFFFKQWGGIRPKSGSRLLEGREWNELPGQAGACKTFGT